MTERSVRCPDCPFSFARLVDAGDHHAYHCPTCSWQRPTTLLRPGNRPADVCALCDRPIDLATTGAGRSHLYVGPDWVHGGGREEIPVHHGCLWFDDFERLLEIRPEWQESIDHFLTAIGASA